MGAFRFLGNTFAFLLMGLCITIIFSALLFTSVFGNAENLGNLVIDSAKTYVGEHKSEVKEFFKDILTQQGGNININKEQLKQLCTANSQSMPKELCAKVDMLTDEQVKDEFVNELFDKQLESGAFDKQLTDFTSSLTKQINSQKDQIEQKIGSPRNYLYFGIIGYLLSAGLVFVLAGFKIKISLYKVARSTFLNVLPIVLGFAAIAAATPAYMINLMTRVAGGGGELSKLPPVLIKAIATIGLSIIQQLTNPLLTISIIIAVLSLALAIIMKILKDD